MGNLSKHFDAKEFKCKCGKCDSTGVVNPELIDVLENLRSEILCPIQINSGHRCIRHNRAVGGVPNSQHLLGNAADIVSRDKTPVELYTLLAVMYPDSLCLRLYPSFVHVDVRPEKLRWVWYSV